MGSNPSYFEGTDRPVEQVSWSDAQQFLEKMNERHDGYRYRLPTEAEWEYAARGPTTGADAGSLDAMAWYDTNSGRQTHPVGQKQPNAWGLYDMHGNVWEWVQDWYGNYSSAEQVDPTGPSSGTDRVLRGGSWYNRAEYSRVSFRYSYEPSVMYVNFGFRCVREAIP
jgi:formylglycine-generating enzyme required for sulfatase activity